MGWTVVIALLVAGAEWGGGVAAGSLALLADAGHMGLDVLALLLAYVARRLARRPPSRRAPWGLKRAEVLAALVNGLLLLGVAAIIAHEALERAEAPLSIDAKVMAMTATFGFVANVACLRLLHGHGHDIGMRGAFLHLLGDAANSLAVVVGALCIYISGSAAIDVGVSLCIAAVVAASSVPLIGHALAILLLLAPTPAADAQLTQTLSRLPSVIGVSALRVWRLTSHDVVVSVQLTIAAQGDAQQTLQAATQAVADTYAGADTTVQVRQSA